MNSIKSLWYIFLILVFFGEVSAQTGKVAGKIFDRSNGELLMFVTILVDGTTIGTTTDLDGNYVLELEPGVYTLAVNYISYSTEKIEGIEVKAGEVLSLDIPMTTEGAILEEVVVTSKSLRNTEGALMTLRRKSFSVQDGISSQEIKRFGSSNAAESMKSVTGASVMGGKYVYLRGIGDRYNSTTLNGQSLPSVDPYRNATQLDLIPASLLDNVVASKTFTPDQPGNSTGGNLNIATKSFPEDLTMSLNLSASYNTVSNLQDDFLTFDGGDTDWLGYDDGGRAIPAGFKDPELLNIITANSGSKLSRELDKRPDLIQPYNNAIDGVSRQMTPTPTTSGLNNGISFSFGNQVGLFNRPLGIVFNTTYNKSYSSYQGGDLEFWELTTSGNLNDYYQLKENRSTESPEIGGLAGLSYKFSPNHKLSFTGIYNHNASKSANYIKGSYPGKVSGQKTYESRFLSFTEREIQSVQLKGEHVFKNLGGVRLDWYGGRINSMQLEPDSRVFDNTLTFRENMNDEGLLMSIDTFYAISKSEFSLPFHYWRDLHDVQNNGGADITIPFLQSHSSVNKLKFGVNYSKKERAFDEFILEYNNVTSSSIERYNGDADAFFGKDNTGVIDTTTSRPTVGVYLRNYEESSLKNSYTGFEEIAAAYGMFTYELGALKIIGGARVETTVISVASLDTFFQEGNIDAIDVLPSLNLIYAIGEKVNLRAAFSQTLARPNMRELAPFASFDRGTDIKISGNPLLKRTNISNYDVRAEWYPKSGEMMAVSGFYKSFKNPIVKAFNPRVANNEIQIINVDEAEVYGVELEMRKDLSFISETMKDFRLITNLSLIQSVVDIPGHPDSIDTEQQLIAKFNPDKGYTRPFQGQSPFLFNAALNYLNEDLGIDALVSFNVFGRRLVLNNGGASPDFYEESIPQLDFSVKKSLSKNVSVKLTARNLLDADYRQTIQYDDLIENIERRDRGITYGLSVSYNIQ